MWSRTGSRLAPRALDGGADLVRREAEASRPGRPVQVRAAHGGQALDRGAVQDPLPTPHDHAVLLIAPLAFGGVVRRGQLPWKPDDPPSERRARLPEELGQPRRGQGGGEVLNRRDAHPQRALDVSAHACRRIRRRDSLGEAEPQPPQGVLVGDAAQLARAARALEPATRRVRLFVGDAEAPQRRRVQETAVPTPGSEQHRVIRGDLVQLLPRRGAVVQHAHADLAMQPGSGGCARRLRGEDAQHVRQWRIVRAESKVDPRAASRAHVGVRIVEAGHDDPPLQLDDARGGSHDGPDLRRRSHRGDALARDGDRFRPRPRGVGGEDLAADQDEVRLAGRRLRERRRRDPDQARRRQQRQAHRPPVRRAPRGGARAANRSTAA